MPGTTGLEIVKKIKSINDNTVIIVTTGQTDYRIVIEYLKLGVSDYIDKNEDGYLDLLSAAMHKGVDEAMERKVVLSDRAKLREAMCTRMEETSELVNKLKVG